MAYLAMDTDPEIEFCHFLAARLSMTVAELNERMPAAEFVAWGVYYGREAQRQELAAKQRG